MRAILETKHSFAPGVLDKIKEHSRTVGYYAEYDPNSSFVETAGAEPMLERMFRIEHSNVCARITDLDEINGRLVGNVIFSGPKADVLKEVVGGREDIHFSIRASIKHENSGSIISDFLTGDFTYASLQRTIAEAHFPMLDMLKPYLSQRTIDCAMDCIKLADDGHDVNHVNAVVMNACDLIETFPELQPFTALILIGAFLHDVGCYINRENHHLESARIATDLLLANESKRYTRAQIYLIANAISQHRASYTQRRVDPVSEAVAAADRGKLGKPHGELMRSIWMRISKGDPIPNDVITDSLTHLKEKMATDGYMWKNIPSFTLRAYPLECLSIKSFFDPFVSTIQYKLKQTGITAYDGSRYVYNKETDAFIKENSNEQGHALK